MNRKKKVGNSKLRGKKNKNPTVQCSREGQGQGTKRKKKLQKPGKKKKHRGSKGKSGRRNSTPCK